MRRDLTDLLDKKKRALERLEGKKESYESSLRRAQITFRRYRNEMKATEKAQAFIQEVAKKTQKQIEIQISDLGSFAMEAIFRNPYRIEFDFQIKRKKAVAPMFFTRNEVKRNPASTGGGARELGSIALRFSSFSLKRPRLRPIMMLDEPLSRLKGSELPRMGMALIKEFSQKMKVQIIMVSHDPEQIDSADKVINIHMNRKLRSIITQ